MILVPAFIYLLKLSEEKSRATAIVAILPMVIASSVAYFRADYIEWKTAVYCAIGGIVGGIIGAKLLTKLSDKILKLIFIVFLLYSSIRLIFF